MKPTDSQPRFFLINNMINKLCHSNLKYLLLNSLQTPVGFIRRGADEEANARVQQRLSNDEENESSDVNANNLYAIMYSKYFTQRLIIAET